MQAPTSRGLKGLVAAVMMLSCAAPAPAPSQPVNEARVVRVIAAPAGAAYRFPVYLPGSTELLVQFQPAGSQNLWDIRLALLSLEGDATPHVIPLPADSRCTHRGSLFPIALPDGRVGYTSECYGPNFDTAKRIMAWDPKSGQATELRPYSLQMFAGHFSFAPDMSRGISSDGHGLSERLQWLWPDRLEHLTLPFSRVGPPVWSPDGAPIAFDATEQTSVGGVARATLPRKMYVMSPVDLRPRALFDGFIEGYRPTWSPDSRQFLVSLATGRGKTGLWLVDVASGTRRLIFTADQLEGSAWLPDGRIVVSVGAYAQSTRSADTPGIYILELPKQ